MKLRKQVQIQTKIGLKHNFSDSSCQMEDDFGWILGGKPSLGLHGRVEMGEEWLRT